MMHKTIDDVVCELSSKVGQCAPPLHRARAVYDWEVMHIAYDRKRAEQWFRDDMLDPEETLARGKGICTDLAALYIAIAQRMGLCAHYVHVDVDDLGETVHHACAAVDLPERRILVDPAYGRTAFERYRNPGRGFDICHQKYCLAEQEIEDAPVPVPCYGSAPPFFEGRQHRMLMAAIGSVLILGAAYFCTGGEPFVRKPKAAYEETASGGRFLTKNGEVEYVVERDAQQMWKEAVFFSETTKHNLSNHELFEHFVSADKDKNKRITAEEAQSALQQARSQYARREF